MIIPVLFSGYLYSTDLLVKEALLIIDIQNFYFPGGRAPLSHPEIASRKARRLISWFRTKGTPIFHIRHLPRDIGTINLEFDREWRFHDDALPREGDLVITKHTANSFLETDLLERLRKIGTERLVICGMQNHMCVEAAVRAAADLGFTVILIHDACATRTLEFSGIKIPAEAVPAATLATLQGTYARIISLGEFLSVAKKPPLT